MTIRDKGKKKGNQRKVNWACGQREASTMKQGPWCNLSSSQSTGDGDTWSPGTATGRRENLARRPSALLGYPSQVRDLQPIFTWPSFIVRTCDWAWKTSIFSAERAFPKLTINGV